MEAKDILNNSMETYSLKAQMEYDEIDKLYDECLEYLKEAKIDVQEEDQAQHEDQVQQEEYIEDHQRIKENSANSINSTETPKTSIKLENELNSTGSLVSVTSEPRSERLRKLSQQLPKIIITQSNTSLNFKKLEEAVEIPVKIEKKKLNRNPPAIRNKTVYGDFPKRLVSKNGMENIALIKNVPFEKIRLLNDTFHTLINLRWRWIVIGTMVVHFAIWLVFAVFWYISALAHYDFEPDAPKKTCVTGGKDFVTIFLASVEAQTTIGFGDRAIDEECPESIFLFIMQLILGTGLSGVLTCVVYAKLTRPEKLSRDGVGFSKKAVISMRDGQLCLMMRAWDLNYDHIICSEFSAHFITTHRTKEGEVLRYYARPMALQQRQFPLWPVTIVHIIDAGSPLYEYTPEALANSSYEITLSLKGASASMGTFTQSQTSYLPREVVWGHRFKPVVRYDGRKQKYVIEEKKLDATEPVDTPYCSAKELHSTSKDSCSTPRPCTPSSFCEKISAFQLERSSSFRKKTTAS